jgi:hypothetical protein
MLTPDVHRALLETFTLEQLLALLELEAKKTHDGHYTIFLFNAGFKVAFGTPDINPPGCRQQGYAQLCEMVHAPTLKEAIIEALVSGKTFDDYFYGDADAWWRARIDNDPHVRALFTLCESIAAKHQAGLSQERDHLRMAPHSKERNAL